MKTPAQSQGSDAEARIVGDYLEQGYTIYCLKNAMDNGIDICATRLREDGRRETVFVEVKSGRARRSKYQRFSGEDFVRERLMVAQFVDGEGQPLPEWSERNDRSFVVGGDGIQRRMAAPDMARAMESWIGPAIETVEDGRRRDELAARGLAPLVEYRIERLRSRTSRTERQAWNPVAKPVVGGGRV